MVLLKKATESFYRIADVAEDVSQTIKLSVYALSTFKYDISNIIISKLRARGKFEETLGGYCLYSFKDMAFQNRKTYRKHFLPYTPFLSGVYTLFYL